MTLTEGVDENKCPTNAHHTNIEKQDFLKIFKCLNEVATENNIRSVEVLAEKSICEQKCLKTTCTLNYVLIFRNYIVTCEPKILQLKKLNLCEESTVTAYSKNKVDLNYIAIVILVIVVFSTTGLVLTYIYRRNKITNISSLVS